MEKERLQEFVKERVAMSVYKSFIEVTDEMPEDEAKDYIYHILRYGLKGETPDLKNKSPLFRIAWKGSLPTLDKDIVKYHNGKSGGAPEGNNNRNGKG